LIDWAGYRPREEVISAGGRAGPTGPGRALQRCRGRGARLQCHAGRRSWQWDEVDAQTREKGRRGGHIGGAGSDLASRARPWRSFGKSEACRVGIRCPARATQSHLRLFAFRTLVLGCYMGFFCFRCLSGLLFKLFDEMVLHKCVQV
jgi:hypothetical protein